MVKIIWWILGYVKFVFTGGFNDGFINNCFEKKLNIQNLKEESGDLNGECLANQYIKLHSIARKNGGRIKIVKKRGLVFPFLKLKNRWGLFIGAILFIYIISFLSGFIWNVEIKGTKRINDSEILSFLEENNVKRGASWRSVDKNKTENLMMAAFDDIAWVHINEIGTRAVVEINETVKKPKNITSKKPANLKAKKDGLIVKASVTSGWAEAKVGDSVTKGDLLISGIYESEQKKGNQFAHASGEYIAEVKESFSLTVSRKQSYKEYGEERVYKKLSFFGINIPLYFISYDKKNSEITTNAEYIKINGNELPIGIITVKHRKYAVKTKILSDRELTLLLNGQIEKKLKEDFSDYEIIKKEIKTSLGVNEAVAKGRIICLENIGEEVIIKIKYK